VDAGAVEPGRQRREVRTRRGLPPDRAARLAGRRRRPPGRARPGPGSTGAPPGEDLRALLPRRERAHAAQQGDRSRAGTGARPRRAHGRARQRPQRSHGWLRGSDRLSAGVSGSVAAMDYRSRTIEVNDRTYAAWNAHDADAVAAVFAEDAIVREIGGAGETRGRAAVRERAAVLLTAFPDLRLERLALVIDGERHADRWVLT